MAGWNNCRGYSNISSWYWAGWACAAEGAPDHAETWISPGRYAERECVVVGRWLGGRTVNPKATTARDCWAQPSMIVVRAHADKEPLGLGPA
jgi:hypothetical protein